MADLAKGANAPVPTAVVRAELAWEAAGGPDVDVVALLLRADGSVGSDADMVFFNQPAHPSGAARHTGKQTSGGRAADGVELALDRLAGLGTGRVVLAAAADGGAFGGVRGLRLRLVTTDGAEVATFGVDGATSETAMVVGELYVRDGGWRLRAVGQGYDGGLAALARDHGVEVDDEPPPSQTPTTATEAASAPVVNLDKGKVDLRKGEKVSLTKRGAPPLRAVVMGLGWDPAHAGSAIDLDASALAFDASGAHVGSVWFIQLHAFDHAIQHTGDNLTGEGEGDDEQIRVDLAGLPSTVQTLVFAITSFNGDPFTAVHGAYCRLVDARTGEELVRYELSGSQPRTAVMMASLTRAGSSWTMAALGQFTDAKNARYLVEPATALVRSAG